MKNDFLQIVRLVKNNKFKDSLNLINNITNHDKNFDLVNLKAFIYFNLKEFQKSYETYSKAIKNTRRPHPREPSRCHRTSPAPDKTCTPHPPTHPQAQ